MYLPQLPVPETSRMMTEVFYGINRNLRIQQGESFAQTNMTLDHYPVMSQRLRRGSLLNIASPQGLLAKEALAWVDGDSLYYKAHKVDGITLSTAANMCPKQLVSMGAYLLVFPDGVYFNTQEPSDHGSINSSYESSSTVTYNLCAAIGDPLDLSSITRSSDPPTDPSNGDYWLDTSVQPQQLKQYSSYSDTWAIVPSTYVQISCPNIDQYFETGDGISLSGIAYSGPESQAMTDAYAALNGDNIIVGKGTGYITITGLIPNNYEQTEGTVTVTREAPKMDYVVESGNRLWGCFYGMVGGKMLNEIYASKLGDFKNWRVYASNAMDSYAVSVGTDGPFTGAITYNNFPFFFKEDAVHQIYGAYPAAYQVVTTAIPGVQKGSDLSLVNAGGALFYKSPQGICQYDGHSAAYISQALGQTTYMRAVSGTFKDKVYMSMQRMDGDWEMLVYDLSKGFWTREDSTHALFFTATEYDLFFISESGDLLCAMGTQGKLEDPIPWEMVSGHIGFEYPDQKYLSRFILRMSLGEDSTARLYVQYDSSGDWEMQGAEMRCTRVRSFALPVIPRRCDHLQFKLQGRGEMKLYSIAKIYEAGSDVT